MNQVTTVNMIGKCMCPFSRREKKAKIDEEINLPCGHYGKLDISLYNLKMCSVYSVYRVFLYVKVIVIKPNLGTYCQTMLKTLPFWIFLRKN